VSESDVDQPSSTRGRVVRGLVSMAVVVAIFVGVLPRVADLSDVWRQISAMTGLEVVSLLLLASWNLATYTFVYMASLPGLRASQGLIVTEASTAIANTVPGGAGFGIGVTWAMFSSWGFRRPEIALSVLVTGVWNIFAKLGLPVLALALVAVEGESTAGSVAAAGAGVVVIVGAVAVFAVMLRSEVGARRVGGGAERLASRALRLVGRPAVSGWEEAASEFRTTTTELLRTRWLALTVATLVSHLTLYTVLLLTLRHVGVSEREVSFAAVLAAYAFVRLISALPLTPGGLGVVELGLTAALVAAGGEQAAVVAAVLVYRALTYLLPIPVGAVAFLVWRNGAGARSGQLAGPATSNRAP
jgi:uncharacterized protein (TIRG00374 family)